MTKSALRLPQWAAIAIIALALFFSFELKSSPSLSIEPRYFINPIWIGRCIAEMLGLYRPNRDAVKVIADSTDATAFKILFIGNSLTSCNDLPREFAQLVGALKPNRPLKVVEVTTGGICLQDHWTQGIALKAIKERGPWDYVVLQGGSRTPFTEKAPMFHYAELFDGEIKRAGAKTVLFETWFDKNQHESKAQAVISSVYREAAERIGALLVPVGEVWLQAYSIDKEVDPFGKDGHHPSRVGTYLAACAFYAKLFNESPVGASSVGLPEALTHKIQQEAWKASASIK